jgi:Holliday junction resolvase RusA-like endonuclease
MQSIFIDIDPIPCPRPRIVVRGRFPTAYYPKPYTEWKERAQDLIETALDAEVTATYYDVPLRLRIENVCVRPKTTKLAHPKPDVDNYAKSVMDALTKAGAWGDDCQVIELLVTKRWAVGEPAGIHIHIQPLDTP